MLRYLYIVLCLLPLITWSQSRVDYLLEERADTTYSKLNGEIHSAVRPQTRLRDTLHGWGNCNGKKALQFAFSPLSDIGGSHKNQTEARIGLGIQTEMLYRKFFWRLGAIGGYGVGSNYHTFNTNAYFQKAIDGNNGYTYADIRTRLAYTPNEVFQFQVGLDNHFFGEGLRSLWLSDYGIANPFGQIKVNFWRIQYDVIYQFMRENMGDSWRNKYATTHHLSVNVLPWLNIGFFENVIYNPATGSKQRGYEWEYLNPVIFLRPQEYAVGSSDNVLIGASLSAKFKSNTLYSQLVVDEFNFTEFRKDKTYWGNKLGGQIGIKGRFKTNLLHHFYRIEFNAIRPYTYAHVDSMHTYGNQGRPLAHPNGANFYEGILAYNLKFKKWYWGALARVLFKGMDEEEIISNGGTIYKPYMLRPQDYGFHIGAGQLINQIHLQLEMEYQLVPKMNLHLYVQQHFNFGTTGFNYWPVMGIRSRFWNDYRNY